MKRILEIAAIMSLAALGAVAQDENKLKLEKLSLAEGGVMSQPVLGAPYSGVEVSESTQTLADGTKIHNEHQTPVFRDGAGRTRRETGNTVIIMDPVAKLRYILNTEHKTATALPLSFVTKLQAGGGRGVGVGVGIEPDTVRVVVNTTFNGETAAYVVDTQAKQQAEALAMAKAQLDTAKAEAQAQTAGEKMAVAKFDRRGPGKTEDAGTQTLEGVVAQGTRTTRTIEAGAIGNDRPISIVSERWFSPQLQTVMMTRQNDPRSGDTIFRLSNLTLGEPDAALFQVPAGYQVTERK